MSLLYKIIGVPRNLDEFVDRAKRERISMAEVRITPYEDKRIPAPHDYYCEIGVKAGEHWMSLSRVPVKSLSWVHLRHPDLYYSEVEREAIGAAIGYADRIAALGLETRIGDTTVDTARDGLTQYDAHIKALEREFMHE